jgi:hypothetical protein
MRAPVRPLPLTPRFVAAFLAGAKPQPHGCHYHGRDPHALSYAKFRGFQGNRVALAIKLGRDIRPGMYACHRCDVPGCVNPDHLYEGSRADNSSDASRKQRTVGNDRAAILQVHGLTDVIVRQVVTDLGATSPIPSIARRHGLLDGTVRAIATGYSWGEITGHSIDRSRREVEAFERIARVDTSRLHILDRHFLELTAHDRKVHQRDLARLSVLLGEHPMWLQFGVNLCNQVAA